MLTRSSLFASTHSAEQREQMQRMMANMDPSVIVSASPPSPDPPLASCWMSMLTMFVLVVVTTTAEKSSFELWQSQQLIKEYASRT